MSDDRPAGEWWLRQDTEVLAVHERERILEVVVIPYERAATVVYEGRRVQETIAPGAFDGIDGRPGRVKLNRDHNPERLVGKAVALYPGRPEGLVAKLRVSRTDLGDETLQLAEDGVLDVSAEFRPMDGGMSWTRNRDAYTVTKAYLAGVGLVQYGAYGEHAGVLAVREEAPVREPAVSGTPNLDLARSWVLELRHPERV